jgi:hypothetical protein
MSEETEMKATYKDNLIGQPATFGYGSDCYPGTVIAQSKSGKEITIQSDNYRAISGDHFSCNVVYEYTPNPNGATSKYRWNEKRQAFTQGGARGNACCVGVRRAYSDPSF